MTTISKNEKGFVLVICLLILLILSVIGASSIETTITDTRISGNVRDITQSRFLAKAGMAHGGEYLMENLSLWDNYAAPQTLIDKTDLGAGHYKVTIEDAGGYDRRRLLCTAKTKSGARANMEAIVAPDYAPQDVPGLFGCDGVELDSDVITQSYSSSGEPSEADKGHVGTSDSSAELTLLGDVIIRGDVYATGRLSLQNNATIIGNGYANGIISLMGSTSISGDAETGDTCSGCGSRVGGTIEEHVSPLPVESTACDPLDIDALFTGEAEPIALHNDNGELSSSFYSSGDDTFLMGGGQTCTLGSAGEDKQYHFTSLTTDADASVAIQGNVSLYVNGDLSLLGHSILTLAAGATLTVYVSGELLCDAGSRINNPGRPKDLKLYSDCPSAYANDYRLRLNSQTDVTAVVYAPGTAIEINSNANFFGAIRGKYVYVHSGASFWYDEDLVDPSVTIKTIKGFDVVLERRL